MVLKPVARRLLPDEVYEQLLDEVVDGALSPGDALPSERRLAELLGVSRPAAREALHRLSATRLLDVRHGGSPTVRDFRRHAGLDLLPRLLVRGGQLDPAVARSIVEARLAIAPEVARMAAERGSRAATDRRTTLGRCLAELDAAGDAVARQHAALAFWDAVVDLADSVVFRMLFNNLRQAYEPAMEALAPLLDGEVSNVDAYRVLCTAVLAGDAAAAHTAATDLLRPASEAMVQFLDAVEHEGDAG
jgi:DNA-binding FadR family transcriptional regulator